MRILKSTLLCGALTAACAMGFATPASAATCVGTNTPYQTDPTFTACYQTDAINGGNPAAVAAYNFGFDQVGYAGPDLTWNQLEPTKDFFEVLNDGDLLKFDAALTGQQFIAIHFGSATGDKGELNDTLFFQFNFAGATSQVDLNRLGFSNAVSAYSTGGGGTGGDGGTGGVPEPGTWAMMLFGFGGIGIAVRRRRRNGGLLAQAA